ncbi:MAG: WD40 repeat protein [Verrucomicrobiales bacterium]|jgi:WD40 repeat protein
MLWDVNSLKISKTLGNQKGVSWSAFDQTGRTLVSMSDKTGEVGVWDLGSKGKRTQNVNLGSPVFSAPFVPVAALSADGKVLIAVLEHSFLVGENTHSEGGDLVAWNLQTGKEKWRIPESRVKSMSLSSDGKSLAAYMVDIEWKKNKRGRYLGHHKARKVQTIDPAAGTILTSVDLDGAAPATLQYVPGTRVLVGMNNKGLYRYDPGTGKAEQKISWNKDRWAFTSVTLSNRSVARASNEYIEINDLKSGKTTFLKESKFPDNFYELVFSPDLKHAAGIRKGPVIVSFEE